MQHWLFIAILVAIGIVVAVAAIPDARERKRRLSRYWARVCTGSEWRRRFPDEPKDEIRRFLDVFIDAFAFKSSQRLKFSPDDKVYEVYRSLYSSLGWADSMELETFSMDLERVYRVDVSKVPNGDVITLGELFQMVRNPNKSAQPMPGERLRSNRPPSTRHGWLQRYADPSHEDLE